MSIATKAIGLLEPVGGPVGKVAGKLGEIGNTIDKKTNLNGGILGNGKAWNQQAVAADQHQNEEMQSKLMTQGLIEAMMSRDWEKDNNG